MVVAGLLVAFRKIERWLHQHIFKLGWLLSHNFQTTTILYYTFFLPGVILHEVIYWLVAGMLNVRAEGAIKWPEPQEIGELKLNFVEIDRRASSLRKALITAAPLATGVALIWLIANNVLNIQDALATMQSGTLDDVWLGIQQLTNTPDFWLWVYLIFAISNTMFPTIPQNMRGWRLIIGILFALILAASAIGIGSTLFETLSPAVTTFLSVVQAVLILMMCVNVLVVLVLGTIEAIIERITGHSATFKRGKMITMTREEAIEERQKERDRERRRIEREKSRREADAAYASIYTIVFPVPDAPGNVPITQPEQLILGLEGEHEEEKPSLDRPRRSADTIEGQASRSLPGGVEPTVSFEEPDEPEVIIPEPDEIDEFDEEDEVDGTPDAPQGEVEPEPDEEDVTGFVLQLDAERKPAPPVEPDEVDDDATPDIESQPDEPERESVEDVLAALNAADMFAGDDDDEDDESPAQDEGDAPPQSSPLNIASEKVDRDRIFNISPFSKPTSEAPGSEHNSDDERDEDEYEADTGDAVRRSRGSDSVRDLFASFNNDDDDDEADDDEPQTSGRFRLGKIVQPPSTSSGLSRPVPKSRHQPTEPDEAEDEDDYDELIYEEDEDIDYYIDDDD